MRYAAILTSFVGVAAITSPVAAEVTTNPPAGIYVRFIPYGAGGSGVTSSCTGSPLTSEQNSGPRPTWHSVQAMSFNIEQTLNIGSQSTGAGAGRVTFNPLAIVMAPSSLDATFSGYAASGTPLCELDLMVVTSQGPAQLFKMNLAAVKTMGWTTDANKNLTTTCTFEYGGLTVVNQAYTAGGAVGKATGRGWNRVNNTAVTPSASDLALRQMMQ